MSEDELIGRAQGGDQAAFRRLVEAHSGVAWRTARVLLADRAAAEDVTQEAWLDAWRALPRFERGRPFRPWLLTLVANRCRMAARRRAPRTVPLDAAEVGAVAAADDAAMPALRRVADAELRAVLAGLPPPQVRVLELRFFGGLELAEIAALTGTPLGTVKSRLHRALDAVRVRLQPAQSDVCCPRRDR